MQSIFDGLIFDNIIWLAMQVSPCRQRPPHETVTGRGGGSTTMHGLRPRVVVLSLPDFGAWDAPSWSALAAWITATTAVIAAVFAWRSVAQARKTREAQAQPYVAVSIEPTEANPQHVYLVVRNFGNTAALGVELNIEPAPRRSGHPEVSETEPVELPASFRTLVPGQEWRTFWDFTVERLKAGLPNHHIAKVKYCNEAGKELSYSYDLDWTVNEGRIWITRHTMHDAAEALRGMSKEVKKWREGMGGGLRVYVRDGGERDRQMAAGARKARESSAELEGMITRVSDEEYRRLTSQEDASQQGEDITTADDRRPPSE